MNYFKNAPTLVFAFLLTGCATGGSHWYQSGNVPEYQTQSANIPPTHFPLGLNSSNMQPYYPIPPASGTTNTAPSLVPPGSQLQPGIRSQNALPYARSAPVPRNMGSLVYNKTRFDQAWDRVGNRLNSSGYKILQKDSSLGVYYVLDTASTGGRLQTSTPIYQVRLTSSGDTTVVTVLNSQNRPADPAVSSRILGAIR